MMALIVMFIMKKTYSDKITALNDLSNKKDRNIENKKASEVNPEFDISMAFKMTAEAGNIFIEKYGDTNNMVDEDDSQSDKTNQIQKEDVLFENVMKSSNNICRFLNRHHEKKSQITPSIQQNLGLQGTMVSPTNKDTKHKSSLSNDITDYWIKFLSVVSQIKIKELRKSIIQDDVSREIQNSLYPKEAASCFLKSFSSLEWSEMREELMSLLNSVRASTEIMSILKTMSSEEHTYAFKDKLDQMSSGFNCNNTKCYSCGKPLTDDYYGSVYNKSDNNEDENKDEEWEDDIIIFGCGHAYHAHCAPVECGCHY